MQTNIADNLIRILQSGSTLPKGSSFRKGQVISGLIVHLYPNQQAEVIIDGKGMIAQLHASLNKGEKYWFQVEAADSNLQLKVLGDNNAPEQSQNIKQLMESIGVKATKERINVLQMVMDSTEPPQKEQLIQTIKLLDNVGSKDLNYLALKEIIKRELPVTPEVYQAFKTKNSSSLTQQMTDLLTELNKEDSKYPVEERLQQKLNQLLLRPTAFLAEKEVISRLQLQSVSGEIINLSSFNEQGDNGKPKSELAVLKQLLNDQLPLPPNFSKQFVQFINLLRTLSNVPENQEAISRFNSLHSHLARVGVIHKLSAVIMQQLPLQVKNEDSNLNQWLSLDKMTLDKLQSLSARQLNQQSVMTVMNEIQKLEAHSIVPIDPKIYFLTKLKSDPFLMGYHYESDLPAELAGTGKGLSEQSLKGLLLQAGLNEDVSFSLEKADRLIQTINGLQLSSVQENENYLQFSVQLPGDHYGAAEDIHMNFESKKTSKGEIDPSYCRILFFLTLKRMKETIIDMNIINRKIALTVYNTEEDERMLHLYKPVLEEGLRKLDYSLVSLTVKPFEQGKIEESLIKKDSQFHAIKGVDFRI